MAPKSFRQRLLRQPKPTLTSVGSHSLLAAPSISTASSRRVLRANPLIVGARCGRVASSENQPAPFEQVECKTRIFSSTPCPPGSSYPRLTKLTMHPLPDGAGMASMPNPCVGAPAKPSHRSAKPPTDAARPPRQARTASPVADFECRPEQVLPCEPMFGPAARTSFTGRLADATDLLIDLATLGEYGLEPVGRTAPSCEGRKRQRAAPAGRPRVAEEPAATYSPRGLPPKYHRRRVA